MNQFLGCTVIFVENFRVIFTRDYRTFLSKSCWLHVAELILRVNPQKKVRFFNSFSMRERDIFVYNEKISCKNPYCISLNYSFTLFLCQIFHFLCFQESCGYSSVQFIAKISIEILGIFRIFLL